MKNTKNRFVRAAGWLVVAAVLACGGLVLGQLTPLESQRTSFYGGSGPDWWTAGQDSILPREDEYDDASGQLGVVNATGLIRSKDNPFFEALGSNGRACITCHQPSNGMSVSAAGLQKRWDDTEGKDAVFAAVDGSNCPDLPQSAKESHSLLLNRGLFRIALPWPPRKADGSQIKPEFRIEVVSDPSGCNNSATYGINSAHPFVSVFRRPRVTANMKYVVEGLGGLTFMADGRESTLRSQAINAAMAHELASKPAEEQLRQIVEFESQIYVAQATDHLAGLLDEESGPIALGPENLLSGKAPRMDGGAGSKPSNLVWLTFNRWKKPAGAEDLGLQREFRASVARGSDVFFGHRFHIAEVAGSNEAGASANGAGTCSSCHSPQVPRWMDIGTTNIGAPKESSELPVFRITCDTAATPHPYIGRVIYTHDPGRALISGKCADTGAIVMQQFHGLSARAPYFANGSAATLAELVEFYERRFKIGLTAEEKRDLVNFLRVL